MNDKVGLDIIRTIAATLDKAVYWIMSVAYQVIEALATINIFKDATDFAMRIYTLIGIFMIFKISFSLINYLINPDSITDKEKGASNLLKRIVITFVLIIMVPQAFVLLREAQSAIMADHVVERLFLGEAGDGSGLNYQMDDKCTSSATAASTGDYIALLVFRPFFQTESVGTVSGTASLTDADISKFVAETDYCNAESVAQLLQFNIYNAPTSANSGSAFGIYRVNYWFIISTLVGGVVAVLMVSFCMDVAVRSIKLGFLELISPVPIISYMDPSQSKNGMFKKWATEVGKTWADLFIRLGALYFCVNIISSLDNIWTVSSSTNAKFWVFIFIIIGALIFAKKLPSLIENILGIKLSGGFTLNPLKKIQNEALGGKAVNGLAVGAGTMAGASIGSAAANMYAQKGNILDKLKSGGKGLVTGAFHGATTGYKAGASGKYNPFSNTMNAIERNSKMRNLGNSLHDQGAFTGPFPVPRYKLKEKFTDVTGKKSNTGTTRILQSKIQKFGIQEQEAQTREQQYSRQMSDLASQFNGKYANYLSEAFKRTYEKNADGEMSLNTDGSIKWNPMSYASATDYLSRNNINLDSTSRQEFQQLFNSYQAVEQERYNAYDDVLKSRKQREVLEGAKGKFEGIKNQGK